MSKQKNTIYPFNQSILFRQTSLKKILEAVQAGNCCRVLGPRYRFKSKLMRQAAATLQENGTHYTIYLSLAELQLTNPLNFFGDLFTKMQQGLRVTPAPDSQSYPGSAFEFQQSLLHFVAQHDRNVALFIDDLEMAPPNLVALLLGALRAVFITVIDQPGARFQAVVCGSLSLGQVALANASRFESVSDLVLVDDLDETECFDLACALCREAGLIPTTKGLQALLAQTAGDLSLITRLTHLCFEQMKKKGQKKVTTRRVTEAIEIFLNHKPDWVVTEILRQIESNPNLLSCALQLLRKGQAPAAKLPIASNETLTVLDLCGAFSAVEGNSYKIKCNLWVRILRAHLTPDRVGRLYAIAGYWPQAIRYLGQAVRAGQMELKSELFTATINAMHASENSLLALGYLAQGLQATYPDSNLCIYQRTYKALELIHPRKFPERASHIPLSSLNYPEIEALDGPDYSIISNASGSRLLFPLRSGPMAPAVGLVALNNLHSKTSPYQRRNEILQIIALLQQAARAIEMKHQILDLLTVAEERADKLKSLNSILTQILYHRDHSEETILHLTLAGITSGWSLGFNRAILFILDDNKLRLRGRLAVGHLSQKEADADWKKFPYQHLEELVHYLLTHQVEEKPLQQLTKHLAFRMDSAPPNLLMEVLKIGKPILSSKEQSLSPLPETFVKIVGQPPEFALVPLRTGDRSFGVLYVDNKFTERTITLERFELLQAFVNQVALALENARTLAAERERNNILAELLNVEEAVSDRITKSTKELFEEIVDSARWLTHADSVVLYPLCCESSKGRHVYQVEQVVSKGTKHPVKPKSKQRSDQGMAAWVIRQGLVRVPNVQTAPIAADGRKLTDSPFIAQEEVQAFVGVRLGSIEEPVGILYINWATPHFFTEEELRIIQIYANFVAVVIPSARRYQQVKADLERRQERLDTMARITSIISSSSAELESDVIRAVLSEVKRAIPQAHNVAIVQSDAQQNLFLNRANFDFYRVDPSTTDNVYRVDTEKRKGVAGRVIQTGQAAIIRDVRTDNDYIPEIDSTQSMLAVPIKINRQTLAALLLESDDLDAFSLENERLLEILVDHVAIAIQMVRHFQLARERELRERTAMMATGLIHDIYSAVANIPDLVDELEAKMKSAQDIKKPLDDLHKAAFDTDRVSSRLKTFVITGQFEPALVDLETLIQKVISSGKEFEPDHVQTTYTMNNLPLHIWADALWIELLLKNLVINAYDAIPANKAGLVNVEVTQEQDNVLIRVHDNGKGIAEEFKRDIFEFGFSTKAGNKMRGIGLYHCRQIATVHKGQLDVISQPCVGTVFTVSLPLNQP